MSCLHDDFVLGYDWGLMRRPLFCMLSNAEEASRGLARLRLATLATPEFHLPLPVLAMFDDTCFDYSSSLSCEDRVFSSPVIFSCVKQTILRLKTCQRRHAIHLTPALLPMPETELSLKRFALPHRECLPRVSIPRDVTVASHVWFSLDIKHVSTTSVHARARQGPRQLRQLAAVDSNPFGRLPDATPRISDEGL